jgi:hypothetical protein
MILRPQLFKLTRVMSGLRPNVYRSSQPFMDPILMPGSDNYTTLGQLLSSLAQDQSEWSQATFGTDQERGPLGALRHLEKEAVETQAAPDDIEEYADCFLLILDAARRAGISPLQLIEAAQRKMVINRQRTWPRPIDDQPVEHVR